MMIISISEINECIFHRSLLHDGSRGPSDGLRHRWPNANHLHRLPQCRLPDVSTIELFTSQTNFLFTAYYLGILHTITLLKLKKSIHNSKLQRHWLFHILVSTITSILFPALSTSRLVHIFLIFHLGTRQRHGFIQPT